MLTRKLMTRLLLSILIFATRHARVNANGLGHEKKNLNIKIKTLGSDSYYEDNIHYNFEDHDGGVIDFSSKFLCIKVVRLDSYVAENQNHHHTLEYSCHYREKGVILSRELIGAIDMFDENFRPETKLLLKGAAYEETTNTIKVTKETEFIWLEKEIKRKILSTARAASTILVFHVTSDGSSTTGTVAQFSDWIFGTSGDAVNAKSQYAACSHNKQLFTEATGANITNGVVEVNISPNNTDFLAISNAAKIIAKDTLGINVDIFDHLVFALPPTATFYGEPPPWVGIAELNDKQSWYRDGYIQYVSVVMHEIGHNLGLMHSNEKNIAYGDWTCIMGTGKSESDTSRCFNGPKMNELGWFKDREQSIDPSVQQFSGKIIGVNDYGISTSDSVLVLEIVYTTGLGNLYITYNKAEGITAATGEYADEVIVSQRQQTGDSNTIKHIRPGSFATISNFTATQNLIITFLRSGNDDNVDYALVEVFLSSTTYTMRPSVKPSTSTKPSSLPSISPSDELSNIPSYTGKFIAGGKTLLTTSSSAQKLTTSQKISFQNAVISIVKSIIPNSSVTPSEVYCNVVNDNIISTTEIEVRFVLTIYSSDGQITTSAETFVTGSNSWTTQQINEIISAINNSSSSIIGRLQTDSTRNQSIVTGMTKPQLQQPSFNPSISIIPSSNPSISATSSSIPSQRPSISSKPSLIPSRSPTMYPSLLPSVIPTVSLLPSMNPSLIPSKSSNGSPSPSNNPTWSLNPSFIPSIKPSSKSSQLPSHSLQPSSRPTNPPTKSPTNNPTKAPSSIPSVAMTSLSIDRKGATNVFKAQAIIFFITAKIDLSVHELTSYVAKNNNNKKVKVKIFTYKGKGRYKKQGKGRRGKNIEKKYHKVFSSQVDGATKNKPVSLGKFKCPINVKNKKKLTFLVKTKGKRLLLSVGKHAGQTIGSNSDMIIENISGLVKKGKQFKRQTKIKTQWIGSISYIQSVSTVNCNTV